MSPSVSTTVTEPVASTVARAEPVPRRRSHGLIVAAASIGFVLIGTLAAFAVRGVLNADRGNSEPLVGSPGATHDAAASSLARSASYQEITAEQRPGPQLAAVDRLASRGAVLDDPALDRFATAEVPPPRTDEIPREQRWRMFFEEGLTEGPYARQLEGVGIELGVLLEGGRISYASSISQSKPVVREGPVAEERRFYMTWSRGDLLKADVSLLAKAGIDANARIVLHFYSDELVGRLAALERNHKGLAAADIELTRFEVRQSPKGYEFIVRDQIPRQ